MWCRPRELSRLLVGVVLCLFGGLGLGTSIARAGGGPESTLVLIDPDDPESLYLGNYYVHARGIPSPNVIYLRLATVDYADFANNQIEALLGELSHRGIDEQIDVIVVASGAVFRIPAAGYISETTNACGGVIDLNHLSVTAALSTAPFANQILAGDSEQAFGLQSVTSNGYFSRTDAAMAFDSSTAWAGGVPTTSPAGERYYLAAMLGYTGLRGNDPDEIVAMIDRSVAADGTQPPGTFYYVKTTDPSRSGLRDPFFDDAIDAIVGLGGEALQLEGVLPEGHHDCLGVMTGWADPDILFADMTLLPGGLGDHLTSWAANFDNPQQAKVSEWIAKGASGSYGTVEEPCAAAGKFPHPRAYVYYFQGLSMAEAMYRSLEYVPFQGLVYGDPLVQPFAVIPTVDVPDAPTDPVSGVIVLTPVVAMTKPGAAIARLDLFVDGRAYGSIAPGESFVLDTALWPDGTHEARIVAVDDSPVATQGRWVQAIETNNGGRAVTLEVEPSAGDLWTTFAAEVSADGDELAEIRILQNHRVVAATTEPSDTLTLAASVLGAGPVRVRAEAEFLDGTLARSAPVEISVERGSACCLPNGTCRHHSQVACEETFGGVYAGDGETCDVQSCPTCMTGDFNTNGSIDLLDFAEFQTCFSDTNGALRDDPSERQADCQCAFDFDDDGDVDTGDLNALRGRLTGPFPSNTAPVAYGYVKVVEGPDPTIVELPASDADGDPLTYSVVTLPAQATLAGAGPTRDLRPLASATGTDSLVFEVDDGTTTSGPATITLRYPDSPPATLTVGVSVLGETPVSIWCAPADYYGQAVHWAPFVATYANSGGSLTLTAPDLIGVSPFVHWVIDGEVKPEGVNEVAVPLDHNVIAVAAYLPYRVLTVLANRPNTSIINFAIDVYGQYSGVAPFTRTYTADQTGIVLVAPGTSGGNDFSHWRLDGQDQPTGLTFLVVPEMTTGHSAIAIFADIPGDFDGDDDVDLADLGAFQRCWSGSADDPGFASPDPECIDAFDLEDPPDGDVDVADLLEVLDAFTGPF